MKKNNMTNAEFREHIAAQCGMAKRAGSLLTRNPGDRGYYPAETERAIDALIKEWGPEYCEGVRRCLGNDEAKFRAHVAKVLAFADGPEHCL